MHTNIVYNTSWFRLCQIWSKRGVAGAAGLYTSYATCSKEIVVLHIVGELLQLGRGVEGVHHEQVRGRRRSEQADRGFIAHRYVIGSRPSSSSCSQSASPDPALGTPHQRQQALIRSHDIGQCAVSTVMGCCRLMVEWPITWLRFRRL